MDDQHPIGTGFGVTTTADEVIAGLDLKGRTFIVTGGYSGLGLETTRVLVGAGAHVIVPARTPDKARANLAGLDVELDVLDLFDSASIDTFAARFLASGRPLHGLVNCAGIMAPPLERNAKGQESQLATNHLGHFALTARLWPALVAAHGARVVSVSSRGHRFSGMDFDDPFFETRAYDKWKGYGQSKTANSIGGLGSRRACRAAGRLRTSPRRRHAVAGTRGLVGAISCSRARSTSTARRTACVRSRCTRAPSRPTCSAT